MFGQHNNADIFSRNVESAELLFNVLKITTFIEPEVKKDKDKEEEGEKKEKGQQLSPKDERIIKLA